MHASKISTILMSYNVNSKGQILFNGIIIPEDEPDNQLFLDYRDYLRRGGSVEPLEDDPTEKEIMIANLRAEYSRKISDIPGMREAIEKSVIESTPIPPDILVIRHQLIDEFHEVVATL
jgi:hypothetical protein